MQPEHPTILAFDTSAAHCAAALLLGGRIVASAHEEMARGQAERLVPLLEDLLSETGLTWRSLAGIGVGIGPGNFTGIRISVSAARGLALGLGIPAIGVSLFDTTSALASGHGAEGSAVPAPRGQVYLLSSGEDAKPSLRPAPPPAGAALSSDYSAAEHVAEVARLAATRLDGPTSRPAPLYVRPADAAPPRDAPPIIL